MKKKPDDRSDNVDRIQRNIDCTAENMSLANDMIRATEDENMKNELKAKNNRREAALDSMRNEIKDEAAYRDKRKKK